MHQSGEASREVEKVRSACGPNHTGLPRFRPRLPRGADRLPSAHVGTVPRRTHSRSSGRQQCRRSFLKPRHRTNSLSRHEKSTHFGIPPPSASQPAESTAERRGAVRPAVPRRATDGRRRRARDLSSDHCSRRAMAATLIAAECTDDVISRNPMKMKLAAARQSAPAGSAPGPSRDRAAGPAVPSGRRGAEMELATPSCSRSSGFAPVTADLHDLSPIRGRSARSRPAGRVTLEAFFLLFQIFA